MYVIESKQTINGPVIENIVYDRLVHVFKYKGQLLYLTQNHGFKRPNQTIENFNSSLVYKAIEYNRQKQYQSVKLSILYNKMRRFENERCQQTIA